MRIKTLSIIVVIIAIIAVFTLRAAPVISSDPDDPQESTISITGGIINYHSTDYGTLFNIELYKGGIIAVGRETWNEGDEIVFQISAKDNCQVKIGIIPAEDMAEGYNYDDYGLLIGQTVSITSEIQELLFTVPKTGEYGISAHYITDSSNKSANFTLEVNKVFNNSLIK